MQDNASQLIAIVDDDESVREATTSLLRSYGLRAETFSSAEAFLNSSLLVKTRCLLLDIGMPGMGGLELQRHLAGEGWRIPIIFITARDDQESRNDAMREGAVDFLSKPFSEQALLKAVRQALKSSPSDERKTP